MNETTEDKSNDAVAGQNDPLVIPLYPLNIDSIFVNVKRIDDSRCEAFRVLNEHGSDAGTISYLGKNEWRVFVDNFPSEKKYFSTNLPMNTVRDFVDDISRTGLKLIAAHNIKNHPPTQEVGVNFSCYVPL